MTMRLASLSTLLASFATVQRDKFRASRERAAQEFHVVTAEPFGLLKWLVQPQQLLALCLGLLMVFKSSGLLGMPLLAGQIRHLRSYAPIPTLNINPATDMGKRLYIKLNNARATRFIQVRFNFDVNIATANATSVINLGLAEALIQEMGITGGGDGDQILADGRAYTFSSDYMCLGNPNNRKRLSVLTTGAPADAACTEFRLWFENPMSVKPSETRYMEKLVQQDLYFYIKFRNEVAGNAASHPGTGALYTAPGTSVITFAQMALRLDQISATGAVDLPLFRPRVTMLNLPTQGVNARAAFYIPVDSNEYLRGITVMAVDASNNMILNNVTDVSLRGDNYEYLGEGMLAFLNGYVRSQQYESSSDTFTLFAERIWHYNFQQDGKLANIYNPAQDSNLRLVCNIATWNAGDQLVILKHSLVRDLWVGAAPDYRRIVAAELPPELAAPAA